MKEEETTNHFPEVSGLEIEFTETDYLNNPGINIREEVGVPKSPSESYKGVIFMSASELSKKTFEWHLLGKDPVVRDSHTGAEPVITTAGDFYKELIDQPRLIQSEVLIKKDQIYTIRRVSGPEHSETVHIAGSDLSKTQKELILDKILGEYKSQGDEVAVAMKKNPETKPDASSLAAKMIQQMDKTQRDAMNKFQEEMEKNLLFGVGVPAEKIGVDPEKTFGINIHKSYFGDDAAGIQMKNPLDQPIIIIPGV